MIRMSARVERASDFCAWCPRLCRFACPAAQAESRETVTPWGLMSLLRHVRREEVALTAEIGEVFAHCTGCLRCQTWCDHDNDVPEAMWAARRLLVERGVPLPAGVEEAAEAARRGEGPVLPAEVLAAVDPESPVVWLPEGRRVSAPETLAPVARLLEVALGERVALGVPVGERAVYGGGEALREAGYAQEAERWQEEVLKACAGRRLLITESASLAARLHGVASVRVVHLVEALCEGGDRLAAAMPSGGGALAGRRVFFHDSCGVGRRLEHYDGPRALVELFLGRPAEEAWQRRAEAACCGGGGLYAAAAPEGARRAAATLVESMAAQGAEVLVTGEQGCGAHLRGAGEVEVLDVAWLGVIALGL